MPKGNWSEFKKVICISRKDISITDIQKALQTLRYKIEITGILDTQTKRELIKFQKENNVPTSKDPDLLVEVLMKIAAPKKSKVSMIDIHKALQELGYDVEISPVLNTQTKAALVQFKRNYNIL